MSKKEYEDEQECIDQLTGMDRKKNPEETNEAYIRKLVIEGSEPVEVEPEKTSTPTTEEEVEQIEKEIEMKEEEVTIPAAAIEANERKKKRDRQKKKNKIKRKRIVYRKAKQTKEYVKEKEKEVRKAVIFSFSLSFAFILLFIPVMIGFEPVIHFMAKEKFTAPGKLVVLHDKKIHLNKMGSGEKIILLEADIGMNSFELYPLQKELSKYATVITYDRAGYGWSTEEKDQRGAKELVGELYAVLEKEKIEGPFTLVGYKHGSIFSSLFYQEYEEEVENMVLLDPMPMDFYEESKKINKEVNLLEEIKSDYKKKEYLSKIGYYRFANGEEMTHIPNDLKEVKKEIGLVSSVFSTAREELAMISKERKEVYFDVPLSIAIVDTKKEYEKYGYTKTQEKELKELKGHLQAEILLQAEENELSVIDMDSDFLDKNNKELKEFLLNSVKK